MCSRYNQKPGNYYDKIEENGERSIKDLEYVGVKCDCDGLKTNSDCQHGNMISDMGFIRFYLDLINSNSRYSFFSFDLG